MRIELTMVILSPRLSDFLRIDHPFSNVFKFGNMFPESHGFVAVPVKKVEQFRLISLIR